MKLEIIHGDQRSEYVPPSDKTVISVGRGNTNDLPLEEKGASRKQFTLEKTSDGWKVVDQLSSNGTVLNGEKVNFAFLKEGDQIRVGTTVIKVHGIGPAKPAAPKTTPSGRSAAPISGRAPAPRPHEQPAPAGKGAPLLVLVGVVLVLGMIGGGVWFITSGKGGAPAPQTDNTVAQQPKRVAELTEADRKLISEATSIAASDVTTAEKLAELDRFRAKLGERGSVVGSRVDEIRSQLSTQLERELDGYVSGEIESAKAKEDLGDFRSAASTLDRLVTHLGTDGPIKAAAGAKGLRAKAEAAQTGLLQRNDEFIAKTWAAADKLVAEKKYDDAITLAEDMLRRAFFKPGDRSLHDMKLEDIRTARRATGQPEKTEDPTIKPSILGGIKGPKPGKLPGANPMLPKGDDSEKELIDALLAATIEAINKKQLTSDKVSYMGDIATAKAADKDKLTINGVRISKGPDGKSEELPYSKTVAWTKLEAKDMLTLFDATPKNTSAQYFAIVVYLFNNGMMDEASKRACELYKRDNMMKDALDNLVATKRKIAIPDGGFVEFEGRFVTPEEKDNAEFNRVLRDVLARFEKGLGNKDKKKREDSDAAFAEMLKMGERAVEPGVKIMNEIRDREVKKLESATGMVAADDAKLRALKDELDKRRAYALELIMDEVKYPYPYLPEPEKSKVQDEVDTRVGSVREIWDNPLNFKGTVTGDVDAVIEGIQTLVKRMGQLDRENKYHTVTPEEDLEYLREIVGKALSIQNYVPKGDAKAKQLVALNSEVMRFNEEFPVGDGHADGDCRAQVKITNRYRIMMGRHALKINDKLFWAAKHHSKYQVTNNGGEIAHEIPGEPKGVTPWDRMRTEGYTGGGSENIHGGVDSSAEEAHYGWCHSSGHHRNILSDKWFVLGVGHHKVWTQVFGSEDEGDGNMESKKGA